MDLPQFAIDTNIGNIIKKYFFNLLINLKNLGNFSSKNRPDKYFSNKMKQAFRCENWMNKNKFIKKFTKKKLFNKRDKKNKYTISWPVNQLKVNRK